MARKDEFDFDIPEKKEKKERPQRDKKESKPLFGEGSFLGGLFKKSSSFDDEFSFEKEKKEKPDNKSSKRLKWWHILLIVLGAIIIVVGIAVGIILGQVNNMVSGGDNGGESGEDIPETGGIVSSVGSFLPKDTQEYILCEYTEYFSGKTVQFIKKESDVLYNYQTYWVFISENGQPSNIYHNTLPDNLTPEETKDRVINMMSNAAGYTPEIIAKCDVHIYQPVSFTRVTISEVTLTDTEVTVKYSAGTVDGEMSEEYTLTGTYTKVENDYTFTYPTLPEDENLLRVAENLLGTAKYESYAQYGAWVNELTFGDNYKLTLTSLAEEE